MASGHRTGEHSLRAMCVTARVLLVLVWLQSAVYSFLFLSSLEERFTGWEAASREETSPGPHQQGTYLSGGNPRGLTVSAGVTLSPEKVITPWFHVSHLALIRGQRKQRILFCLVPTECLPKGQYPARLPIWSPRCGALGSWQGQQQLDMAGCSSCQSAS